MHAQTTGRVQAKQEHAPISVWGPGPEQQSEAEKQFGTGVAGNAATGGSWAGGLCGKWGRGAGEAAESPGFNQFSKGGLGDRRKRSIG